MIKFSEKGMKTICYKVIYQALKDYKYRPNDRENIEKWLRSEDNIFIAYVFPDIDKDLLVKGAKNFGKIN